MEMDGGTERRCKTEIARGALRACSVHVSVVTSRSTWKQRILKYVSVFERSFWEKQQPGVSALGFIDHLTNRNISTRVTQS